MKAICPDSSVFVSNIRFQPFLECNNTLPVLVFVFYRVYDFIDEENSQAPGGPLIDRSTHINFRRLGHVKILRVIINHCYSALPTFTLNIQLDLPLRVSVVLHHIGEEFLNDKFEGEPVALPEPRTIKVGLKKIEDTIEFTDFPLEDLFR